MKRWMICTTGALIFAIIFAAWLIRRNFQEAVSAQKTFAHNANPPQTDRENFAFVSALGRIEPRSRVVRLTASPAVEGSRVARLLVKEGDAVKVGQTVAILDNEPRLQASVVEAQRQVEIAKAKLAQVEAGAKGGDILAREVALQRLEAERRNAAAELKRTETLHKTGDASASELDGRKLAADALTKDIERTRAELEALREVRPVDVRLARAEVESLEAAVVRARANLELAYVRSLTKGSVLKIHVAPGEAVSAGDAKGMFEIGETDRMYVVAEVFEADIQRVRSGQATEMTVRSTNRKLTGFVETVGMQIGKRTTLDTDPVADLDSRVVEVRIRLNADDSRAVTELTNLRVDVQINAQSNGSETEGGRK